MAPTRRAPTAAALALFLLAAGCAAGAGGNQPLAALADRSGIPAPDLAAGRAYFLRECGSCHGLVWPGERSPEAWERILAAKAGKVPLTAAQFGRLNRYILAASRLALEERAGEPR